MLQMKLFHRWRNVFDRVVAVSDAVKRRLVAEGIKSVDVIGNGIPVQAQRPSLVDPPTVGFAGRLVREKGAGVLVKAFATVVEQIPNAQLVIAGDGPEQDRLNKLINDLEISSSISMVGRILREEVERLFASVWVQAIPSTWADPFPTVGLEAMMRGTAVVASRAGGLPEIVQDGETGFIVPPDDEYKLAEAMILLLRNRELVDQMGRAGHSFALKHFSEEVWVEKYIRLYQVLCAKRSNQ